MLIKDTVALAQALALEGGAILTFRPRHPQLLRYVSVQFQAQNSIWQSKSSLYPESCH